MHSILSDLAGRPSQATLSMGITSIYLLLTQQVQVGCMGVAQLQFYGARG